MPSDLDRAMDAKAAALTGPGGPLALSTVRRRGVDLPAVAAAPPSLPHYLAHWCARHRDLPFLVAGDERLTFGEVHAHALAVARALGPGHGVARGDRVGIAMRNSPAWIAIYMGVLMAGGVATLLNGWWREGELADAAAEVGCALVFADPPRARRLAGAPVRVVEVDDAPPIADALAPLLEGPGKEMGEGALPELGPNDPATILFTSGSTGRSKGALSDHGAVLQGVHNFLAQSLVMLGLAVDAGRAPMGQPATLLNLPLFHITGEVTVLLQSFAMGRKLVLMTRWDAEEAMRLIERERVTYFVGVPLMSFELLTHPRRGRYDLSSVTDYSAGGAARPPEHVRRIEAEMGGGAPLIGYGLTETNAVGTANWRGNYLAKPDSAGRASPLVELAILDADGRALPVGERGEVGVRSAANFTGYWNRPDDTAAAFTVDGYFRTGDVGRLDADGYLFIVDRLKDVIIRGGENISCQEVEAAIHRHPDVAECAVFGLAHGRLGEAPGAVVRPRPGAGLTAEDLAAFLGAHLAAFKAPHRIWITAEPLPRLGTEKINKAALKAEYRARAAGEG